MDDSQEAILERNLRREADNANRAARPSVYLIDFGEIDTVIRVRRGELRFCGNVKFVKGDIALMKIRDALMEIYPKDWEPLREHTANI